MSAALPLLFVGPLLAAVVSLLIPGLRTGRVLGLVIPAVVAGCGAVLVALTHDGSVVVAQVAGWPGGVAIPFAADLLSALMVTVSALLVLASMLVARAGEHAEDRLFAPLVLVMTAGVYGAFLTADLFNLFVMVEVALLPSYALMARSGRPGALAATRLYLTVNLTGSTLFLAGLGAVYGTAGTLNLAALAGRGEVPAIAVSIAVVLVALAIKGALVPVHSWMPATYPHATPAVTALLAGSLSKVGLYGIVRVVTVAYEPGRTVTVVVVTLAVLSMVVGVLGALGETSIRGVLAFHSVSQVGYVLAGLALAGPVGLTALVFYLVHYSVVKSSLFLTGAAVEVRRGTGSIKSLGGVANDHRVVGLAFLLAALSLTGLPPFSGFWAKLGILGSAADEGSILVLIVALVVSAGTLISMLKLGAGVFWGERPAELGEAPRGRWPAPIVLPGLALALMSLVVGLYPEPLLELAANAGAALAEPTAYVEGVLAR